MKRKLLIFYTLFTLAFGFLGGFLGTFFALQSGAHFANAASSSGDWPMFMGDEMRDGNNLSETSITASTASQLALSWKFTTGNVIAASPVTSHGVLYMGAWDGYEYAINISTHQQIWRTYAGITSGQAKLCYGGGTVGPTSSPTVNNGVVYVGGGDGNMYALNVSDGSVLWKTFLGSAPVYLWASPLFYNNRVYMGVAGFCDPPYAQGKVVAFDPTTGNIVASVSLFSGNQTGAPVISAPAVNANTNKIFVTTGNPGSTTYQYMPYSEAILALDPTSLNVLDHWQVSASDQANDIDFIGSPTLFTLSGTNYIGAENKNGYYYVLNQDNLAAGPVWKKYLDGIYQAVATDNDSTACYHNGVIYTGGAAVNGTKYYGSIDALNAQTGSVIWSHDTPGPAQASVTCTSDLVIDAQGQTVEVRSMDTGNVLFHYTTGNRIQGTPMISNGVLYASSRDHSVYAFTLPNSSTFQDNFDSYNTGPLPTGSGTNQWTTVNVTGTGFAVNVSNAQANSAPNSLQFTMGSGLKGHAWASKTYSSGFTSHAAEFSLFLDPSLTFDTQAITLFTARNHSNTTNGSVSVWLSVGRRLQVIWYDSTSKKHVLSTSSKLSSGQWYKIELDQTNDPVNGSWSLWLNDLQIATQAAIDTGNTQVNSCIAGDNLPSVTAMSGVFYEDNVVTATQHIG